MKDETRRDYPRTTPVLAEDLDWTPRPMPRRDVVHVPFGDGATRRGERSGS